MSGNGTLTRSPSGQVVSKRGRVVIPQIAVAASSTGSGSFTFEGASAGDTIIVNARASLGNVSAPQAFSPSANRIDLIFSTGGAALTIPTQTFDVQVDSW